MRRVLNLSSDLFATVVTLLTIFKFDFLASSAGIRSTLPSFDYQRGLALGDFGWIMHRATFLLSGLAGDGDLRFGLRLSLSTQLKTSLPHTSLTFSPLPR
ncbi:MAG: hypothetical protein U0V48_17020 [Anaerolineales bacterium]